METDGLADALETDRFKRVLDHVPVALAVSVLKEPEKIVYVNFEFVRITGLAEDKVRNHKWEILNGEQAGVRDGVSLAKAIVEQNDWIGSFRLNEDGESSLVELHSNVIEDDDGAPTFRLVAMVDAMRHDPEMETETLEASIRKKDTQLRELQHRVKNNLQMIAALIRLEARKSEATDRGSFSRLAGRVSSLAQLYDTLSLSEDESEIDLGVYLSQIATAVMATHSSKSISLDLQVDPFPVSINVAMPTGLVVNELLTNALKHAFEDRENGTITLTSIVTDDLCTITVADDGVGLPDGETWPKQGRLGALIAESLRQNAKADLDVQSKPGQGTKIVITFKRPAVTLAG
ncbi:MAG: sensor histidine kinase [Rhodobacterales bacterium]